MGRLGVVAQCTFGSVLKIVQYLTTVRNGTSLDRAATAKILNRLIDDGQLERRGSRRGTHYTLRPLHCDLSQGRTYMLVWIGQQKATTKHRFGSATSRRD